MTSVHPSTIIKPIEAIHPDNLPSAKHDHIAKAFSALVERSANSPNVAEHIHAPMHIVQDLPWVHSLIPGIEKLAAKYHVGNYVAVRGKNETFFESMPLYVRLGMHLVFYGKEQVKLLGKKKVEEFLCEHSVKQGAIYDSPKSAEAIPSFVHTYSINLDELLEPDIKKYSTFNEFFYRKLKPDARPVQSAENKKVVCSAADCRLTVYQTVDLAQEFWIKGNNFNIPNLLNLDPSDPVAQTFKDASLAICRLAPADYHRFHSPIDGIVGKVDHFPGQYYTVNPQAVNEPGLDVFTANTRSVLYMEEASTGLPVAFVAIGALLVGSIRWTGGGQVGQKVVRGQELGHFAYGGSTIVVVFPKKMLTFDDDLVANSKKPIETLVKVGNSIGMLGSVQLPYGQQDS
jgi:phosphatidylserine decarboxylase